MHSDKPYFCGLVLVAIVAFASGFVTAIGCMERESVKRGFAEYNQKTGAWQWKESEPQP